MTAQLARAVGSAAGTLAVFGFGTLIVTGVLTNSAKSLIRLKQASGLPLILKIRERMLQSFDLAVICRERLPSHAIGAKAQRPCGARSVEARLLLGLTSSTTRLQNGFRTASEALYRINFESLQGVLFLNGRHSTHRRCKGGRSARSVPRKDASNVSTAWAKESSNRPTASRALTRNLEAMKRPYL